MKQCALPNKKDPKVAAYCTVVLAYLWEFEFYKNQVFIE